MVRKYESQHGKNIHIFGRKFAFTREGTYINLFISGCLLSVGPPSPGVCSEGLLGPIAHILITWKKNFFIRLDAQYSIVEINESLSIGAIRI